MELGRVFIKHRKSFNFSLYLVATCFFFNQMQFIHILLSQSSRSLLCHCIKSTTFFVVWATLLTFGFIIWWTSALAVAVAAAPFRLWITISRLAILSVIICFNIFNGKGCAVLILHANKMLVGLTNTMVYYFKHTFEWL